MLRFYVKYPDSASLMVASMDHDTILSMACLCPTTVLAKDIEEWRNQAKHGDTFRLGHTHTVLALDVENEFGIR